MTEEDNNKQNKENDAVLEESKLGELEMKNVLETKLF